MRGVRTLLRPGELLALALKAEVYGDLGEKGVLVGECGEPFSLGDLLTGDSSSACS